MAHLNGAIDARADRSPKPVAFAQAGAALATTIVGALPSLPYRDAVQHLFEASTRRS